MSRLSDLVNEAVINHTSKKGVIAQHDALTDIKPKLDQECRETLIDEALTSRITAAAKRGKSAIAAMAKRRNMELPFNIDGAYPLNIEDRYIKRTEALTREEMLRVINIREKQIVDDKNRLAELRNAFHTVDPIWQQHPTWTFGQCCSALLRKKAA